MSTSPDPARGLSVLHVIVRVGPTNSQWNEHCLPVTGTRRVTVCSLFPASVRAPESIRLYEGDGTVRGCLRSLRRTLLSDDYDVVHVHAPASGMLTLLAYLLERRRRDDLVFTVHNSWTSFRRRNRLFLRVILAWFPLAVVCGRAAYDTLPAGVRRGREHRILVVPNGVDIDRVDATLDRVGPPERAPGTGRTVVSLGRLIPIKDPQTLLRAFARARGPQDRLVVIGDGPMRGALVEQAGALGIADAVSFTGVIPRDEVYRELAQTDLVVSCSTGEGLPVAVLEAMACATPVLVSDIAPHREVAAHTAALPLVPCGDVAGFADQMRRLLDLPAQERAATGTALRACATAHFSVRTMNRSYGEVYRRMKNSQLPTPVPRLAADPGAEPLSAKLRRRAWLLVAAAILGGAAGFVFAHVQTPEYKGETTLVVGPIGAATDEDTLGTSAALAVTYADLTRREPVLGPVARQGFADSWRDLQSDVHAQVGDKNPQLVQISVYDTTPRRAVALADAVAAQLAKLTRQAAAAPEQSFVAEQTLDLRAQIESTSADLDRAERELEALPPVDGRSDDQAARAQELRTRVDELRSGLVELQRGYADLDGLDHGELGVATVADPAWPTRSPLRPTPLALVVAGAGVGVALVVGWVQLFSRDRRRRDQQPQVLVPVPWDPEPDVPAPARVGQTGEGR